jgi:hypothetical protein
MSMNIFLVVEEYQHHGLPHILEQWLLPIAEVSTYNVLLMYWNRPSLTNENFKRLETMTIWIWKTRMSMKWTTMKWTTWINEKVIHCITRFVPSSHSLWRNIITHWMTKDSPYHRDYAFFIVCIICTKCCIKKTWSKVVRSLKTK